MLHTHHPLADEISLYVQNVGGYFEIHRSTVEFYVPKEQFEFTILKYPFLKVVEYTWPDEQEHLETFWPPTNS
jgi:hypothetical protein